MSQQTIGQIRLVRFHTEEGVKAAFVRKGRKFFKVVEIDTPISVRKVRIAEERYMRPLKKGDSFYPYKRAVGKFLRAAKQHGITSGAKQILEQARSQGGYYIEAQEEDLDPTEA